MIITNNPNNFKLNQTIYNRIVDSLDLDSIPCDSCSSHDWSFHASYERKIDILNNSSIIVARVICNHCRKTHVILIEGMIPFSSLSHHEIIHVLSNYDPDLISFPYLAFLKRKYFAHDIHDYFLLCLMNSRSFPVIFAFST